MFHLFGISFLGILQLICIAHVLIMRKDMWWIALLLFMPGLSAIIYTWTEFIPSLRHSNLSQIQLPIFQKLKIKEYEHALEECDSVDNRVNLAEMYAKFNRHEEALTLIKDCMTGPCKDSPDLIFTCAIIQFENGNAAEALVQLDKLDKLNAKNRRKERRLLRARVLDKLEKFDEADKKFSEALKGFDGEEARYRYADFLLRRERRAEALAQAQQGIEYYKKSERLYRRIEAYWYSALKMVVNKCRKHTS